MTRELLISAVKTRNTITFIYDGKPRLVEPHAVGINHKGELVMRGYQVEGESATSPRAWKLLMVDKMVDLKPTVDTFPQARDGYKTGDKAMRDVLAELPA